MTLVFVCTVKTFAACAKEVSSQFEGKPGFSFSFTVFVFSPSVLRCAPRFSRCGFKFFTSNGCEIGQPRLGLEISIFFVLWSNATQPVCL